MVLSRVYVKEKNVEGEACTKGKFNEVFASIIENNSTNVINILKLLQKKKIEGHFLPEFQVFLLVDTPKFKIAENNALILLKENSKIFKQRTSIIESLCSRTNQDESKKVDMTLAHEKQSADLHATRVTQQLGMAKNLF